MNDHDLLIRLDERSQTLVGEMKNLNEVVGTQSKDHEARLKRLERLADRVMLIGTILVAVGSFIGWLLSQIPQWISAIKH